MTPKEKAEELISNFHEVICSQDSLSSKVLSYQKAKKCAEITVDEITTALLSYGNEQNMDRELEWWDLVKFGIQNT